MSEEERKESDRAPGEPDWESLRAVHPAPPPPFPARPKARPKADDEEPEAKDDPSKRSRRGLIVAIVLGLLGAVRLFERMVNGSNRAR